MNTFKHLEIIMRTASCAHNLTCLLPTYSRKGLASQEKKKDEKGLAGREESKFHKDSEFTYMTAHTLPGNTSINSACLYISRNVHFYKTDASVKV